jgi:sigma-B regulation protein RsbU (phosphoserine phosphatase)
MLVADVAGKGIPATLVMMVSRIVIRTLALHHTSVAEIINEANDGLLSHNGDHWFVTAWLGILDLRTGHMEFASAGHKAPVVRRKNGSVEFVNSVPDIALVVKEDFSYNTQTLDLHPCDTLFMYTDGVTGARNGEGKVFGKDSLLRALAECGDRAPAEINNFVKERLDRFTGDVQQLDDMAMLTVRYDGVPEKA